MTGRKYADVAFNFAMGGVDDCELFDLLERGHVSEVSRFGHRRSCGVMDLVQMTEKLACAGTIDQSIFGLVGQLVRGKEQHKTCLSLRDMENGRYSLLSDHPLRMLWRFAAKQRKHGRQRKGAGREETVEGTATSLFGGAGDDVDDYSENGNGEEEEDPPPPTCSNSHTEPHRTDVPAQVSPPPYSFIGQSLNDLFLDVSLPLVLDLGCGFGVAQLGLCMSTLLGDNEPLHAISLTSRTTSSPPAEDSATVTSKRPRLETITHPSVNFLGCDMSPQAVGYASGISRRWGITGCCAFVTGDVTEFLRWVRAEMDRGVYTGPVCWACVNFPTPYSQSLLGDVIKTYSGHGIATHEQGNGQEQGRGGGKRGGNSQLPACLSHFMVTPTLIRLCTELFSSHGLVAKGREGGAVNGVLYMQSNAEDVGVVMNWIVRAAGDGTRTGERGGGMVSMDMENVRQVWSSLLNRQQQDVQEQQQEECMKEGEGGGGEVAGTVPPQRRDVWRAALAAAGVEVESGEVWIRNRPFTTPLGLTETEAIYMSTQRPIYRLVFAQMG